MFGLGSSFNNQRPATAGKPFAEPSQSYSERRKGKLNPSSNGFLCSIPQDQFRQENDIVQILTEAVTSYMSLNSIRMHGGAKRQACTIPE
ncbi:hypothetical protein MAP00_006750 [Monascus purpureus]|nr:hypothetical protein MAP00_006750 [Monascus purpureus]